MYLLIYFSLHFAFIRGKYKHIVWNRKIFKAFFIIVNKIDRNILNFQLFYN